MSDTRVSASVESDMSPNSTRVFWYVGLWVVAAAVIYADTLISMVHIWATSETFTHGFVIAPISIWLCWQMRREFVPALSANAGPWFLLSLVAFTLLWFVANLVAVQLAMQLAFVGVLVSGLAAVLGYRASRIAVFPLLFLFLAVPMGLGLEPPMMDLTAHYTVKLIQLTGIPVYQEGRYFQLPSGSWSVVEACSGVRYLIASFTLGLLFAHLNYQSLTRKLLFVVASILVPIVANVLRAYLIVMLGHLSGMKLATGVDHLIYGWVFFGLVMLVLFWIGGRWAQPREAESQITPEPVPDGSRRHFNRLPVLVAALLLAGIAPLMAEMVRQQNSSEQLEALSLSGLNCYATDSSGWEPAPDGVGERSAFVCAGTSEVRIVVDRYLQQEQGAEMQDYRRALQGRDGQEWQVVSDQVRSAELASGATQPVRLNRLRAGGSQGVWVATWQLVNEQVVSNAVGAKLFEAWSTLVDPYVLSARIFVVLDTTGDGAEQRRDELLHFVSDSAAEITATVADSVSAP